MNSIFRIKFLAAAILSLGAVVFAGNSTATENLVLQDLDYTDQLQTLPNYDRGFYTPQILHIKHSGTKPIEKPYGKLLHLRAEISDFSSNACWKDDAAAGGKSCGTSSDLTEDALNVLQTSFDNIRNYGGKVIVRICYDPWYNGISDVTPAHQWVLKHVKQLAPVLSKNTDVILALEMGMHGAYGEMHSDTAITSPRVAEAVNLMLQNTPPELKILTRTGNYSAAVLGFENWGVDFHVDGNVFKKIAEAKGDTMYRVGMFNDGYLGTQYDYGTWGSNCETSICREEGVAWLEKYSINTPYGGEALTTASGYQVINTPEFLAYEGFRTHTSYLNIQWNYNLINDWKVRHFTGKDFEYDGSKIDTLTGFKFIDDHLGYRYVLRESRLIDTVASDAKFHGSLKIQNVGFGNLTQKRPAQLLIVEDVGNMEKCPAVYPIDLPDVDFRNVHSRTIQVNGSDTTMTFDGTNTLDIKTSILAGGNDKLYAGNFFAYLKLDGIQFANKEAPITCDLENHALYLGKFAVDPKKEPPQKEETDKEKDPLNISNIRYIGHQKNQPSVERADNKIQVRDPRGSGENRYFRVNGKAIR